MTVEKQQNYYWFQNVSATFKLTVTVNMFYFEYNDNSYTDFSISVKKFQNVLGTLWQ